MKLQLHNTLTRRKDEFVPIDPSRVRMYVCGPTVYDLAHIGNARPVVVFDVLYRLLRRIYGETHVTYVRNITDVDDKIIERARESGEPIDAITKRTTEAYHADMAALGALPPTLEPRATQHIGQMCAIIAKLIENGNAYVAEGHVLFSVPSAGAYGKLSGRSRDEQIAGARVDVAPFKRDPADFVLWKPSTPELPGWDSPWGRGRPGWHIECSAMAAEHLGTTFDIHGGGIDLVFPHHENEIAQSECAHGAAMANYWLHNGFLEISGAKMSKSLGNFFTVRELLEKWPGEAIRLLLLKTHYRSPLDFTERGLQEAKRELDRFYIALRNDYELLLRESEAPSSGVLEALADDVNTPEAIARMHELATNINRESSSERLRMGRQLLADGAMLGLLSNEPGGWLKGKYVLPTRTGTFRVTLQDATLRATGVVGLSDEEIDQRVATREAARRARDFREADRIRDELKAKGIVLEDGPAGTMWRRAG